MKSVDPGTPEVNGYNMKQPREQGHGTPEDPGTPEVNGYNMKQPRE